MKIRVKIFENDFSRMSYYRFFEVVSYLPIVGDTNLANTESVIAVDPVSIDCEQGSDDVFAFDYYRVTYSLTISDDDDYVICYEFLAIPKNF